jgi:hypothetical protein
MALRATICYNLNSNTSQLRQLQPGSLGNLVKTLAPLLDLTFLSSFYHPSFFPQWTMQKNLEEVQYHLPSSSLLEVVCHDTPLENLSHRVKFIIFTVLKAEKRALAILLH